MNSVETCAVCGYSTGHAIGCWKDSSKYTESERGLPELSEPVAYIDAIKARRLGQKIPMTTTLTVHRAFPEDVMLFTAAQMLAIHEQGRLAGLEEAARACLDLKTPDFRQLPNAQGEAHRFDITTVACASAIRALAASDGGK